MKAQRRHELQQNDLAQWLGKWLNKISSGAEQAKSYSRLMIGVAILVGLVVVFFAVRIYQGRLSPSRGVAWTEYFLAFDSQDALALSGVAKLHTNETVGLWAAQSAGDFELARASSTLYGQRDEALASLNTARDQYEIAMGAKGKEPLLYERALYGLAQTHECLAVVGPAEEYKNHLAKAKEYYEQVAALGGESALAAESARRVEQVEQLTKDDFYAWLAENKPEPPASPLGLGGATPDLSDVPDMPGEDFEFPAADDSDDADEAPSDDNRPAAEESTEEPEGTSAAPEGDDADSGGLSLDAPGQVQPEPPDSP